MKKKNIHIYTFTSVTISANKLTLTRKSRYKNELLIQRISAYFPIIYKNNFFYKKTHTK